MYQYISINIGTGVRDLHSGQRCRTVFVGFPYKRSRSALHSPPPCWQIMLFKLIILKNVFLTDNAYYDYCKEIYLNQLISNI